jgi:hypothetical protein
MFRLPSFQEEENNESDRNILFFIAKLFVSSCVRKLDQNADNLGRYLRGIQTHFIL